MFYFISMIGLSHSRYISKVHQKLSHLVSPTPLLLGDDVVNRDSPLSEKEWLDFCQLTPTDVSSDSNHPVGHEYNYMCEPQSHPCDSKLDNDSGLIMIHTYLHVRCTSYL